MKEEEEERGEVPGVNSEEWAPAKPYRTGTAELHAYAHDSQYPDGSSFWVESK